MDDAAEVRRKQTLLRDELGRERNISLRCHDSAASQLEGVFARGDRRLADVLERAFSRGASFDSWEERLRLDIWEEAFAFCGVDPARYLGTLPLSARLPWDHFDIGLEQGFLAKEYRKALVNRLSPPCGKAAGMFIHHTNVSDARADERRLVCYDCGVACDMGKMRKERIAFLQSMGALEPTAGDRDNAARDVARGAPSDVEPDAAELAAPELERPPQPGERHERWRISFEKLGPSALLGHLDFMRELGRVVRRAGLRPVYSQGFNPKPRFTFSPALALGVASLDEKIEVDLIDAPDARVMLEQLNHASGAGLRFFRAERLEQRAPSLGTAVVGARYIIVFPHAAALDAATLDAKIAEFLQRDRTVIKRTVKGIGRLIDVKPRIQALRVGDEATRERIAFAGIGGRLTSIVAEVAVRPDGSVKPSEIVEALLGDGEVPHQTIRDALLLAPATSTKPDSPEISAALGGV
jgi:radical SAM-linked protein